MNIFSLLAHISLLIHIGKDVQGIVENLVQKKEAWPSQAEYGELIDDALAFLASGLINLPPDLIKTFTDALTQVKSTLKIGA